jgi:hypothetical protein
MFHFSPVSPARKRCASPIYSSDSCESEEVTPKKKSRTQKTPEGRRARSASPDQLPDDLPDNLPPIDDKYSTPDGKSVGQGKRWTPRKETLLASMWEEEPHLYDSLQHDYKNTYKRKQTLSRFSAALNIPGKYGTKN